MLFIFIVGVTYLASMALMTPYLQTLMGYPVVTAGLVMGPRGLGTMVCMFLVGRLIGKVDTQASADDRPAADGLGDVRHDRLDTERLAMDTIAVTGFIQGAGLTTSPHSASSVVSFLETGGDSAQAVTQRSRSFRFCRICSSENPSAKKRSATSPGTPRVRPSLRTAATSAA